MPLNDNQNSIIFVGPPQSVIGPLIEEYRTRGEACISFPLPAVPGQEPMNSNPVHSGVERMIRDSLGKAKRVKGIIIDTGSYAWGNEGYRMELSLWKHKIETSLEQIFLWVKYSGQHMARWKKGKIILVLSNAVFQPSYGSFLPLIHDSALESFIRAVSKELGAYQISIIGLAVGIMEWFPPSSISLDSVPMKREGRLSEFFRAIDFLMDPESNYISGQILSFDGGLSS